MGTLINERDSVHRGFSRESAIELRLILRDVELTQRARAARWLGHDDLADRLEAGAAAVRERVIRLRWSRRDDPCRCGGDCCGE